MSEEVQEMFARIAGRYDLANSILSGGVHHIWRRKLVKYAAAKPGNHVLDVACGTGDLSFALQKVVGANGSVIGVDFVPEMIKLAQQKKLTKSATNISFQVADAMALPFEGKAFDLVSISFGIRNVDKPLIALQEFLRVLKPGGKLAILEFGQPTLPIFSSLYQSYSKHLMPRIGGLVTGDRAAYEYLPETSKDFPCRNDFGKIIESSGFENIEWKSLTAGIAFMYRAKKSI